MHGKKVELNVNTKVKVNWDMKKRCQLLKSSTNSRDEEEALWRWLRYFIYKSSTNSIERWGRGANYSKK